MKHEFKYSLGQKVWAIRKSPQYEYKTCPICDGKRSFIYREVELLCYKCNNDGFIIKNNGSRFDIEDRSRTGMTIGSAKVEIELPINPYGEDVIKETYMCEENGVGLGTIWNVEDLFISEEEALAECERRNKELKDSD